MVLRRFTAALRKAMGSPLSNSFSSAASAALSRAGSLRAAFSKRPSWARILQAHVGEQVFSHRHGQAAAGGGRGDHLDPGAVGERRRKQRLFAVDALVAGGGDLAGQALEGLFVSWSAGSRLITPEVVSIQTSPGRLISTSVTSGRDSHGASGVR